MSCHLIDTTVFDMTYSQAGIDFEQRSAIDNFVKNNLMLVVDEVFNEMTHHGCIFRISSLEIDLGHIPYHAYQDEMPKRLREQLVSKLGAIRHNGSTGQVSNGRVIRTNNAEQAALFYFLRHGYLPWYSRLSSTNALEMLLKQTIERDPDKFKAFLHHTAMQKIVIERLVNQFSENALKQVFHVLSACDADKIIAIQIRDLAKFSTVGSFINVDKLLSALFLSDDRGLQSYWSVFYEQHAQRLEKALRDYGQQAEVRKHIACRFSNVMLYDILVLLEPSEHEFIQTIIDQSALFQWEQDSHSSHQLHHKAEIWEFSLGYLLVERGSQFNKKSYLSSLVTQMAAARNQSQSELLVILRDNIALLPKSNKLASYVLQFLAALSQDWGIASYEGKRVKPLSSVEPVDNLFSQFASTLLAGDGVSIQSYWSALYENHAPRLEQALRYYGQQAKVRKHIACRFSDVMLHDILVLLEPSEHEFIQTIIDQSALFQWEQDSHSSHQLHHKAEIWEFSLGYLLVERGNQFNKKSYLSSLVTQMAAARNQHQSELLVILRDNIALLPKSNKLASYVLQFLAALSQDWGIASYEGKRVKPLPSVESMESYKIYEHLKNALMGVVPDMTRNELVLLEDIEVLSKKTPWLFLRLCRELQIGVGVWDQVIQGFSVALLRQLVHAQLSLTTQTGTLQPSDFMTALQANAEKSNNQQTFYCQIFKCLIKDEWIDFEALKVEVESPSVVDAVTGESVKKFSAQPFIVDIFYGDQALSNQVLAELIRSLDLMLVQQPLKLRQLLETVMRDEKFIKRVTERLPAPLQVKLFCLFLRLYRELQIGVGVWDQVIQCFSVALLRQLVHAQLSLTTQTGTLEPSDFMTVLQANAEKSNNQQIFYCQIFKCLIKDEWIDFEALKVEVESASVVDAVTGEPVQKFLAQPCIVDIFYGDQALSNQVLAKLIKSLEHMFIHQPRMLRQLFESGMGDDKFRARLVELLPEWFQVKLLSIMGMANPTPILQCTELINMACYSEAIGMQPQQLARLKWQCIYAYLITTGPLFNERYFVTQYADALMVQAKHLDTRQFRSILNQQLLQHSLPSTRDMTQRLVASLSGAKEAILPSAITPVNVPMTEPDWDSSDEQTIIEEIDIANAGMVLMSPYLPRLFGMFGLTEKSAFKNREAAERGVHILQYLVNERVASPEFQLVLNKLICGVKTGRPIKREIPLSTDEKSQLDGLLLGMIQHWTSLGKTSITGLRESFLQRHGRLQLKDDAWHLAVTAKSFDMLLDQIPWAYSTIKFPWMDRVIYVTWR